MEHSPDRESEDAQKKGTRSEVWGTNPTRQSERISNQAVSEKILITKDTNNAPEIKTPKTYSDAIESPEGKLWKDAMDYELAKLEEMNTWSDIEESDISQDKQILPGMWVHLIKNLESGERKYRSRWVVRGDQQKVNLSLSDTFAPVSCISSLRLLLALAALKDL